MSKLPTHTERIEAAMREELAGRGALGEAITGGLVRDLAPELPGGAA